METWLIISLAALAGLGRGFEVARSDPRDPAGHAVVRLFLIATLAIGAATSAQRFSGFLFYALMPLGAFYAARSIGEVVARAAWWPWGRSAR